MIQCEEELQKLIKKYHIFDALEEKFSKKGLGKEEFTDYCMANQYYEKYCAEYGDVDDRFYEEFIATLILIRDFVHTKKYIDLWDNQLGASQNFLNFSKELDDLFAKIKNELDHRKQEDIIVNWVDALRFDDAQRMPYLTQIMNESIVFDNAYTVCSATSHVLDVIMQEKKLFEDRVYLDRVVRDDNSPLLRFFKENNIKFRFFADNKIIYMADEYCCGSATERVASMIHQWDMLNELLMSEQRCFFIVHDLSEIHPPYRSLMGYIHDTNPFWTDEQSYCLEKSVPYTDEQLSFYGKLYSSDYITRIYFADHGNLGRNQYDRAYYHVPLFIYKKNIKKRHLTKVFSYYNMAELFRIVVRQQFDKIEYLLSDMAQIHVYPLYAKSIVENHIAHKDYILPVPSGLGFRAVYTPHDYYIATDEKMDDYYMCDFSGGGVHTQLFC